MLATTPIAASAVRGLLNVGTSNRIKGVAAPKIERGVRLYWREINALASIVQAPAV